MRGRTRSLLGAALMLVGVASGARADLPRPLARGSAGPFEITVLADAPLQPGSTGWIVWLDDANVATDPARVTIELGGMRATGPAPGPIAVHLHAPGRTQVAVSVRSRGRSGTLRFEVEVEPPRSLADHWRAVAIVPLGLLLFALHQWRAHGAAGERPASHRRRP